MHERRRHDRWDVLTTSAGTQTAPAAAKPEQRTAVVGEQAAVYEVAVLVPTRNERDNVVPLVERVGVALAGRSAVVLFVDDSDDDTPAEVERVSKTSAVEVRLLHRPPERRSGGLGGAVLAGLRTLDATWAVVMDGDLQHPPELVPAMVDAGTSAQADVVVASRHVAGGSTAGLSNKLRLLVSDASTALSKSFFPRRLRGVSDPMSGFFAVRRGAFDLDQLHPRGFKILLEMLVRTPGIKKTEVGFVFGERLSGESKASIREGLRFIGQLCTLSLSRVSLSRRHGFGRGVGFAAVGVTGLVVNLLATWLLADQAWLAINYVLAAIIATQLSSTWNFLLTDRVVYAGPKRYTGVQRWAGFLAMSNVVLLLRIPALALLVTVLGLHYLAATAATLLAGFLVRFKSQERLTLTKETT